MTDKDYDDLTAFGDTVDQDILKHRDAHFGGNFKVMLDYYRNEGKGVNPVFDIQRIEDLAAEELRLGKNIAPELLGADDAEEIKKSREAYKSLRELYTIKKPKSPFPILISNLILSEDAEPEKEINDIVQYKSAIVPFLIDILKSEDMYNPLFPGYGRAPYFAANCLGRIGDKRAIIALFESIGHGDFFDDEYALNALKAIGEPAKTFLLRVLHAKPLNEDNERAAISLIPFKDDPEVAKTCFSMLKEIDLKKDAYLATYLILACEGLKDANDRKAFETFSKQASIPRELKNDFNSILHLWQSP